MKNKPKLDPRLENVALNQLSYNFVESLLNKEEKDRYDNAPKSIEYKDIHFELCLEGCFTVQEIIDELQTNINRLKDIFNPASKVRFIGEDTIEAKINDITVSNDESQDAILDEIQAGWEKQINEREQYDHNLKIYKQLIEAYGPIEEHEKE